MCAAVGFMLGMLHLLLWFKDWRDPVYLLSAVMTVSGGANAVIELVLMHATSIDAYGVLMQWAHLSVFCLLVSMVWFVRIRLSTARRWLAILITMLWSAAIVVNWLSPYSLVFSEITSLTKMPIFWGESYVLAAGDLNPWAHLANLASVLIVIYVIDASVRAWRKGDRRRAVLVGGSVATFMLIGGVHTPLVDAGLIATPYMISFAYLAIVLALSYELVSHAVMVSRYAKEIQASERRWASLLTGVELAVIGIDPQGQVTYANPYLERLIGHPLGDLIGKSITSFVPASDRGELNERLAIAARTGPRPQSRWDLVCASGEVRSLAWSTVPLADTDNRYDGLISIGSDETERLAAERDLERTRHELERLGRANVLGELVSALAHEINQPLTAILHNAQAARRFLDSGDPDPYELREILDDIARDDKSAGEIVHRLRLMFRKGEFERQHFRIQETVRETLRFVNGELGAHGISIKEEVDSELRLVEAGRVEIQQVLINLLMNAVHAMSESPPDKRRVCIQARRHGEEMVSISVEDTGPGIDPDSLATIFEPFFTTRSDGLGMGLAICRRIVEAHGGQIWAENTDSGACFSFTLLVATTEQTDD